MLDSLTQDLRFAARKLRHAPGFAATAIVTIALGIAANVGVFRFVDALFLKTLPVKDGSRLVRVLGTELNRDDRFFSYSEYAQLRAQTSTLSQMVVHYSTAPLYISVNGQNREAQGAVVSANYFPTLGLIPKLGRFFTPQEDAAPDRDAVVVIGYRVWQSWFNADPGIVGRTMQINSRMFQIIGVAPEGFRGIEVGALENHLWIPAMMLHVGYRWCDAFQDGCTPFEIVARLNDDATIQQASAEMAALMGGYAAAHPGADVSQSAWAMTATGARPGEQRSMMRVAKLLSLTAIALLVVACMTLAGMLIVRGESRTKEIAMRLSLGAPRRRILQQLLTESMLLAMFGGALGTILSMWGSHLLAGFYTVDAEGYQSFVDLSLDTRVILYAVALSVLTGALFGILPAFSATRHGMAAALKAGAVSLHSPVRTVLVATQIALALTLLVGAVLVGRSVAYIEGGGRFDPSHVVLLRLRPRLVGYAPEQAQAFQRTVAKALESLPGVISMSLGGNGFVWEAGGRVRIALPAEQATTGNRARSVWHQEIGPRLFETLRVPFVRGRDFDDRDRIGSPRVAIVSESLAHLLWPDATALDRTILVEDQPHRVVGVVKDYQLRSGVESVTPILYIPYWQNAQQSDSRMCVRVADDPAMAIPRIKAAIEHVDPNVPITETMPLAAQVRGSFVNVRLARSVLLGAGGLALLLSAIGLYGVVDFMVGRRRREIGIRMALGARPEQILRLFLKQGLTLASIGGAAGLPVALLTLRWLASFLYGVEVRDPVSILSGIAVLLAVASLAAYLPARRAALLDPVENLRAE